MKLKELKNRLSYISDFSSPDINLEQYITPSDIAALFIFTAHTSYDDIEGRSVVDLCSGTGMLSIAASFYNPKDIKCVEIDRNAIELCKENLRIFDIDNIEVIHDDIHSVKLKCDTVLMNPPFGTRSKGADIRALETALGMGNIVYSMHKRSTRDYIKNKFLNAKVIAEVSYELGKTYKHQKKDKKIIEVDLYRFAKD